MDPKETPGQKPEPQEPTTPPAAPVTPPPADEDELVKLIKADPVRARDEIKALREEAAANRKKAADAEKKREEEEKKKLEEQGEYKTLAEKQKQEIADLKAAQKKDKINAAVALEAAKAHIKDPADVLALADLSKVDVSETGVVAGVAEAVAALVTAKPYLVESGTPTAPPSAPHISPTNPGSGPQFTRESLRKMSAEDIAHMDPDALAAALKQ